MMIAIVAIAASLVAIALILAIALGVVVHAIRQEPADAELRHRAPGPASQVVRRLLGVYVRRPDHDADETEEALPFGRP